MSILLEQYIFRSLITEASRFEFLLKTYGQRVAAKFEHETNPVNVQHAISELPGEDAASKVLQYIISHDPSRNQQYSQWMTNCWLRGGMNLEDLERATGYLTVFAQARSRIEKRDINQYKTLADVFDAVEPFMTGQVEVSARSEQDREAEEMYKQAELVHDDADIKIVIPKTQAASCYFGKNTQWCTAATQYTNQFDYYSRKGPLYIILDKKKNKRWQFQFPSTFMDERDLPIDMTAFIRQYPNVVKVLGRQKFLRYFKDAGLGFLEPEERAAMTPEELALGVKQKSDMKYVPKDHLDDYEFVKEMVMHLYERLSWLPPKVVEKFGPKLAVEIPRLFKHLPKALQTPQLMQAVYEDLEKRGHADYVTIRNIFPDKSMWTPAVEKTFYLSYGTQERDATLKDIPEKYWSEDVVIFCLRHHPKEIKNYEKLITPSVAKALVGRDVKNARYLPTKYFTQELCHEITGTPDKTEYYNGTYVHTWDVLKKFSLENLDKKGILFVLGDRTTRPKFSTLPERFKHDEDVVMKYVDDEQVKNIPDEFFTHAILQKAVTAYGFLKRVNPALLTDDLIIHAIKQRSYTDIFDEVPKSKKTLAVMTAFVAKGDVPVKAIPKELATHAAYAKRISKKVEETKDIPKAAWDENLAKLVVNAQSDAVKHLPKHLLTSAVLAVFLKRTDQSYHSREKDKALFSLFPKETWTPATVTHSLLRAFIDRSLDAVPNNLLSSDSVAFIMYSNPEEVAKIPPRFKNEATYARMAEMNAAILSYLDPDDISEEVCFAAIKGNAQYDYRRSRGDWISKLPKDKFLQRDWEEAAGYLYNLKEIPSKFRTPELVEKAINRDNKNLRFFKDPASYIKKHNITINRGKYTDPDLENYGLLFTKNGDTVSINKLPREPIADGIELATVKPTKSANARYYLFVKGKYVARFFEEKGELHMPTPVEEAMKYQKAILVLANKKFTGHSAPGLVKINIYDQGRQYVAEENLDRTAVGNLEWSRKDGSHIAWVGKKAILRMTFGRIAGRWGQRASHGLTDLKIIDIEKCSSRATSIVQYINSLGESVSSYRLTAVGIVEKDNHLIPIRKSKVLAEGNLVVWTGHSYLSLWKKNIGMVAYAVMQKNGKLGKLQTTAADDDYEERDLYPKLLQKALFALTPDPEKAAAEHKAKQQKAAAKKREQIKQLRDELVGVATEYGRTRANWDMDATREKIAAMDINEIRDNLRTLRARLANQ